MRGLEDSRFPRELRLDIQCRFSWSSLYISQNRFVCVLFGVRSKRCSQRVRSIFDHWLVLTILPRVACIYVLWKRPIGVRRSLRGWDLSNIWQAIELLFLEQYCGQLVDV